MAPSTEKQPNGFVRNARKVYNPIGFHRGYNFVLFFIFGGAMFGFVLARFEYLSINGVFCNRNGQPGSTALPGQCYWYKGFRQENVGIILHLAGILPASFLAVFQFVPVIRHKFILYHRIAGYLAILLALCGSAGALMVTAHAFEGDNATRTYAGALVLITTISLAMAYYNIKRLQIDQHRAWMLRAWFQFATIITLRIIMIIGAQIVAHFPAAIIHLSMNCNEILYMYSNAAPYVYKLYPSCNPTSPSFSGYVPVAADFNAPGPESKAASFAAFFGAAGWLAILLHAVGVEVYLKLTPRESERLRQVSYERQMERGMSNPGSAGLVVERFGDAEEWVPMRDRDGKGAVDSAVSQHGGR